MLKVKKGRPRMANPSHHYSLKQWAQHDQISNAQKALEWIKKNGLSVLLGYSFPNLLKTVYGKKPKCFAIGKINTLPGCQRCIEQDSISKTEGFFDLEGKELGPDAYGVYCACWISTWIKEIGGRA
jgi:hypothetical protein